MHMLSSIGTGLALRGSIPSAFGAPSNCTRVGSSPNDNTPAAAVKQGRRIVQMHENVVLISISAFMSGSAS